MLEINNITYLKSKITRNGHILWQEHFRSFLRAFLLYLTDSYLPELIKKYPQLAERLGSRALMVNNPDFKTGVAKIQQGDESLLKRQEKTALSFFC